MREVEVEFAVRDGARIAYEIFGTGPVDLVICADTLCPIDVMWDLPQLAAFMDALGQLARVIVYDPRGSGASDSQPTTDGAAGIESMASDLLAVLDTADSKRASLFNLWTGSVSVVVAAIYPQRVRSLIVNNLRSSFPEMRGMTTEQRKQTAQWLSTPAGLKFYNPRVAHDPVVRRWWGRAHRLAASPEQLARQMEFAANIDFGSVLEQVHTPTLVFHRRGNQMWDIETSRVTAGRMPNARFVELDGSENELFFGDTAPVLAEIERFLREPDAMIHRDDRQLATVLFTDMVASTERLASLGDAAFTQILNDHDRMIDHAVTSYRGTMVKRIGDGILATFDGPARAVCCAADIRNAIAGQGIAVRAGLHTGEIELREGDVAGLAVHIASRIATLADSGEILVSRTVVDLTAGSGITYDLRGEYELKGIEGSWPIFAAHTPATPDS